MFHAPLWACTLPAAAVVDGRIFVIPGGPRPGGSLSGTVEIFAP